MLVASAVYVLSLSIETNEVNASIPKTPTVGPPSQINCDLQPDHPACVEDYTSCGVGVLQSSSMSDSYDNAPYFIDTDVVEGKYEVKITRYPVTSSETISTNFEYFKLPTTKVDYFHLNADLTFIGARDNQIVLDTTQAAFALKFGVSNLENSYYLLKMQGSSLDLIEYADSKFTILRSTYIDQLENQPYPFTFRLSVNLNPQHLEVLINEVLILNYQDLNHLGKNDLFFGVLILTDGDTVFFTYENLSVCTYQEPSIETE